MNLPHSIVSIGSICFVRTALLAVVCLYAQSQFPPSALSAFSETAPVESEYSYQFLHQVGGPGEGGEEGEEGDAGESVVTRTEVTPVLTPEEQSARDSIRNVLRLVDGDTVQVGKEIQVKLIGVDAPEFESAQRSHIFEQLTEKAKKWMEDFITNPQEALERYEGMNSKVNYKDKNGSGFVFYYLYFPNPVLEDIRRHELKRYEKIAKKIVSGIEETDRDRSDAAKAALKTHAAPPPPQAPGSLEKPESVDQYVISEAKYYHDDGSLKRAEVFRDGKLIVKRTYDKEGNLLEETFNDPQAQLYAGESSPKSDSRN